MRICDSPIDFLVRMQNRRVLNDDVIHHEDLLLLSHAWLHLQPEQVGTVHVDVDLHLVTQPLLLPGHQPLQFGQGQLRGVGHTEVGDAPLQVRIGVNDASAA